MLDNVQYWQILSNIIRYLTVWQILIFFVHPLLPIPNQFEDLRFFENIWKLYQIGSRKIFFPLELGHFGTSVRCSSGWLLGCRLLTMTYSPLFSSFFSFPPPIIFFATFSHRRSARIKKLNLQKLIGNFGAPWRPFFILKAVRRCRR